MSRTELTDLHMIVLSWLNHHPGHTPEDIAKGLRADVDEIGTASSQTTWRPPSLTRQPWRQLPNAVGAPRGGRAKIIESLPPGFWYMSKAPRVG